MTSSKPSTTGSQPPAAPPPKPAFILTGHSFPGREHIYGSLNGNGNQDSYGRREVANGLILVSADGCGSAADSATGSKAAVRIILNAAQKLLEEDPIPKPEEFAAALQVQLLKKIKACARPLAADDDALNQVILSSYLFTCLVGIISPEWSAVFGCGDGIYAVNGKIKEIQPREDNHPEYLAYLICNPVPEGFEDIGLKLLEEIDTSKLTSLFVGSDGLDPLLKPHKDQRIFPLERLWTDRDLREASAVDALFEPMQMDQYWLHTREGAGGSIVVKQKTLRCPFDDDTTFVCAIRNSAVSLPTAWTEYRSKYAPPPTPAVLYAPPETIEAGSADSQSNEANPGEADATEPAGAISTAGDEDEQQAATPVPAAADPQKTSGDADQQAGANAPSFGELVIQWLRGLFNRWFGNNSGNNNSNDKGGN